MNFAIHAGHAVLGARGASKYLDEVDENRKIKTYLIKYLKANKHNVIDCTTRTGTQLEVLQGIKTKFLTKGGDNTYLNISLHLNAGGGNGFEIWTNPHYNAAHKTRLTNLSKDISKSLSMTNRGSKTSSTLYVLNNLPNCILLEVGFVDSKKDFDTYKKIGEKEIAEIIGKHIIDYANKCLTK